MNFPIVKEYKFDITGKDPDNKIKREPIEVDQTGWTSIVVPVKGPFYTKSFSLALPDGTPLVLGKDYRFYSLMGKLTEYTGQPVACMVELLKENVSRIYATYQCLGDTSLWDSNLIKLVMSAIADDRPVWWDNLHNKPTGFPMEVHGHSFKYQIVAFQETIAFFNEVMEYIRTTPDLIQSQMTMMENIITSYIQRYSEVMEDIMTHHRDSYNAHALTKAGVGLGNVDNFKTATSLETASGASNRLHMTPPGLDGLIKQFGYVPERMLKANSLPMSSFGGKRFVPPSIDGSYECLGLEVNKGALCLEQDGTISCLSPRFDGKQRGIYFSTIENPTVMDSTTVFKYNAFKYRHPTLEQANSNPDMIVGGSDGRVLMFGVNGVSTDWWITLSNDTLDSSKHVLKKVDTSAIVAQLPGWMLEDTSIAYLEDIVVIFCHGATEIDTYGQSTLFYVKTSDLASTSTTVKFLPWNVTYDHPNGGGVISNTNVLDYTIVSKDGNGYFTKCYHNINPPVYSVRNGKYRTVNVTSVTNPVDKTEQVINTASHWHLFITPTPGATEAQVGANAPNEAIWKRKGSRLTLIASTPVSTLDYRKKTSQNLTTDYNNPSPDTLLTNSYNRTGSYTKQNSVILSEKMRGTLTTPSGTQGGNNNVLLESFDNVNTYDVVSNLSVKPAIKQAKVLWKTETMSPPFKRGISPLGVTFTRTGLIYTALSPVNGVNKRVDCRLHQSFNPSNPGYYNWGVRPEVSNETISPLYSLPIGDPTLETEGTDPYNRLYSNVTGNNAFLSTITAGYGLTIGNYGTENNMYPISSAWGQAYATTDNGVLLKDPGNRFLYYSSAVVNKLKSLITTPNTSPVKMVEIYDFSCDLNEGTGYPGGKNLNLCVALVSYGVPGTRSKYLKTVIFRPQILSNGSGKYNSLYTRIVETITVFGQTDKLVQSNQTGFVGNNWDLRYNPVTKNPKKVCHFYVSGDKISAYIGSAAYSAHIGNNGTPAYLGDITISTLALTPNTSGYVNVIMGRSYCFAVPRVGICRAIGEPVITNGGSALIVSPDNGVTNYCIANTYLKEGWNLYIEESDLIFNGNVYTVPQHTLDIRDTESSPGNKTFYLYVRLVAGVADYYVSLTKLPDTLYHMWIGKVITNTTQIVTIERSNVLSLNGIRISTFRQGSAIMGSSGNINGEGTADWFSGDDLI